MFEAAEKAKIIRIMTGLRVTAFRGEIRSQRIRRGAALWVGLLLTLALTVCAGEPGSSMDQVTRSSRPASDSGQHPDPRGGRPGRGLDSMGSG